MWAALLCICGCLRASTYICGVAEKFTDRVFLCAFVLACVCECAFNWGAGWVG